MLVRCGGAVWEETIQCGGGMAWENVTKHVLCSGGTMGGDGGGMQMARSGTTRCVVTVRQGRGVGREAVSECWVGNMACEGNAAEDNATGWLGTST